jgi:hypothetical protein
MSIYIAEYLRTEEQVLERITRGYASTPVFIACFRAIEIKNVFLLQTDWSKEYARLFDP